MSQPGPEKKRCPLCGKPVDARFRPFCSKRCADIDLGRWLKGDYAIPVKPQPEDEEDGDRIRHEERDDDEKS